MLIGIIYERLVLSRNIDNSMGRSGKANYMCTNVGRLDASMCKLSCHCFYLLSTIENIVIS